MIHPIIRRILTGACLILPIAGGGILSTHPARAADPAAPKPNIVIIYSDDVGWGDIGCYGATRVATPHIDALASKGIRFTDAHTSASTCTPSRYSLLTGQYSYRNRSAQILSGDASMIIKPGTQTIAQVFKDNGYATACIGKWHLGLGKGKIDWNGEINATPLDIGFDESFIIPATPDRVPCVYVEGRKVVDLDPADPLSVSYGRKVGDDPTGRDHREMLRYPADGDHSGTIVDRISRIGYMAGGHTARWKDEQMMTTLTQRAEQFITGNAGKPFFLYLALNDVHVPRAPGSDFLGKSQCGLRGDQIEEMDWSVGQIIHQLDQLHLTDNTLILFSSDNGPVLYDGYKDGSIRDLNGHKPSGPFRGGKYEIYEGGTRVPFIVYWPGHTKQGVSGALISQVDLLNSLARLAQVTPKRDVGPDSQDESTALLDPAAPGRTTLIEQAGTDLAVRHGKWKLIPAGVHKAYRVLEEGDPPPPPMPTNEPHLFDLSTDPGERHDLAAEQPALVAELTRLLPPIEKHSPKHTASEPAKHIGAQP